MLINDKFSFFVPIEIQKSDDAGEDRYANMRFKGIASSPNLGLDTQGQRLMPGGFDYKDFLEKGNINYHHNWKKDPLAIIGEPVSATVTKKNEFYVEGYLYPSNQLARNVYDAAQVLEKDSKTRRLGFSIEGRVMEVDSADPNLITRAKITNVAITSAPSCSGTKMEIFKGGLEDLEYEEIEVESEGVHYHVGKDSVIVKSADSSLQNVAVNDTPKENIKKKSWKNEAINKILDIFAMNTNTSKEIFTNKIVPKMNAAAGTNNPIEISEEAINKIAEIVEKKQALAKAAADAELQKQNEAKALIEKTFEAGIEPFKKTLETIEANQKAFMELLQKNKEGELNKAEDGAANPASAPAAELTVEQKLEKANANIQVLANAIQQMQKMPGAPKAFNHLTAIERFPQANKEGFEEYSLTSQTHRKELAEKLFKKATDKGTYDHGFFRNIQKAELGEVDDDFARLLERDFKIKVAN